MNVDTGKMAWYFQTSPHDMHDWDSAQTPILVDGTIDGRPRKLVLTAARNGYFFVVDRVTGEHVSTMKYGSATNWTIGLTPKGGPQRNPVKDASTARSCRRRRTAPSTGSRRPIRRIPGYFYVAELNGCSVFYLTDADPRGSMGLGGHQEVNIGSTGAYLTAIDYKTGKVAWRHLYPTGANGGGGGILATAGRLVFAGDGGGNLVAHNDATGAPLWHTKIGNVTNPPQTWSLDGHQYLIAGTGDTLDVLATPYKGMRAGQRLRSIPTTPM